MLASQLCVFDDKTYSKSQEAVSNVEITVTKQKQLLKSKIPSIS